MAADGGGPDPVTELTEALRLARRELKLARTKQEVAEERLQRVRRERAALRRQVTRSARHALARLLSERYWATGPAGLAARLVAVVARPPSSARWSPRSRPASSSTAAGTSGISRTPSASCSAQPPTTCGPARTAAEPGPDFDTQAYLEEHPEVRGSHLPALVHRIRRGDG